MELKLISTEMTEATIQVTYTDGQPVDNAKASVVVRLPFDGDLSQSFLWNRVHVMQKVADWAGQEFRRLRDEYEGR
jgi:hypothetical protein